MAIDLGDGINLGLGLDLGEGIKKKEAARIRKELLADPTIAAMPENVREDIIMGAIRKAEEERFRKFHRMGLVV